jgi:hypothetical protein
MSDGPRNRPPFTPSGDRSGRGRDFGGNRRDEGPRNTYGNSRDNNGSRDGGSRDRGSFNGRRDGRPANPQSPPQRAVVHYQVVMMDEEEWGDTLENRLNALGREGWRLVAIDDGRQYVFMQAD